MNRTTARTAEGTATRTTTGARRTCAGGALSPADSVLLVLCVLGTVLCTVLDVGTVATWAFAGAAAAGGLTAAVRAARARRTGPR